MLSTPEGAAHAWLGADGGDPRHTAPSTVPVTVWKDAVPAELVRGEPSELVSAWLGRKVVLVRMPIAMRRVVDQKYARPDDLVSFADGFPVLVANEASLRDLNARLETPVGMECFRPNVVIDGLPAFAEDQNGSLALGATARVELVKPCSRCSIVTVDPVTAVRGKEPLATLAKYRSRDAADSDGDGPKKKHTLFATNALVRAHGPVRVGDPVAFTPRS